MCECVDVCVTCKFDIDARVCISKITVKKPLIKARGTAYLYSIAAPPPSAVVFADAQPTALLVVVHLHYSPETQEQLTLHSGQG